MSRLFITLLARLALLGALAPLPACEAFESVFFSELSDPDPCDPAANVYQDGIHYFERDNVERDGQLDYDWMFEIQEDLRSSPCDPLHDEWVRERERESALEDPVR